LRARHAAGHSAFAPFRGLRDLDLMEPVPKGALECLQEEGAVREATLVALLGAEIRNAREQVANRALSATLGAVQGANEESLARVLGHGPGGRGVAPRVMALGLLHLSAQLQQPHAGPGSFGPLKAGSEFMAAYEAELLRVRGLLAGAHEELLHRLADLGRQLPPAGTAPAGGAAPPSAAANDAAPAGLDRADDGAAAAAAAAAASPGDARAAELEECARLRGDADAAAAALIAVDDAQRAATGALARLAAAYDEVMAEAAARLAAAAAVDAGGSPRKRAARCEAAPLTAVCSHSAPGCQGRYTAGEADCLESTRVCPQGQECVQFHFQSDGVVPGWHLEYLTYKKWRLSAHPCLDPCVPPCCRRTP
jgi:hypothetical protein